MQGTGVAPFERGCRMLTIGPSDTAEVVVHPDSGRPKTRAVQTVLPEPQEGRDEWDSESVDLPLERGPSRDARRVYCDENGSRKRPWQAATA
jgi:hypothetical protein